MKKVIPFLIAMLLCSGAWADGAGARVFYGAVDETVPATDHNGVGMLFDARTSGTLWAGAEMYFWGDGLGLSAKAGLDMGPLRLSAGVGTYGDSLTDGVDVAGVTVQDTAGDEAHVAFVEAVLGNLFVRYSRADADFSLSASRQTGVDGIGNPIYSSASRDVSTRDDWLWAGVRFGF